MATFPSTFLFLLVVSLKQCSCISPNIFHPSISWLIPVLSGLWPHFTQGWRRHLIIGSLETLAACRNGPSFRRSCSGKPWMLHMFVGMCRLSPMKFMINPIHIPSYPHWNVGMCTLSPMKPRCYKSHSHPMKSSLKSHDPVGSAMIPWRSREDHRSTRYSARRLSTPSPCARWRSPLVAWARRGGQPGRWWWMYTVNAQVNDEIWWIHMDVELISKDIKSPYFRLVNWYGLYPETWMTWCPVNAHGEAHD